MSKQKNKRQPETIATAEAKCHSDQRLVMAKRRIKKKYPKAYAYRYAGPCPWVIYSGEHHNRALNVSDKSQRAAWEAARS